MKTPASFLATSLVCISALALVRAAEATPDPSADYLKLRNKHGITQAVGAAALSNLRGSRVVELQGVVKGCFDIAGSKTLVFERTDGDSLSIDAKSVPDWLVGNNVPARLMVQASRSEPGQSLKATLLAAAPEARIRSVEEEYWRKESLKRVEVTTKEPPAPMGNAVLYGPIGRGAKATSASRGVNWRLPGSEATPLYARFIKNHNRKLSNEQAYEIAQCVVGFSLRFGVDARLVMAVLITESDFNPSETSNKGAMGLGQLMPVNVRELGLNNGYDTEQNLYGTVKLLRGHLEDYVGKHSDFDALVLALAAYNAGPNAVKRHGGVPPYRETQNYVRKVINTYRKLVGG